jgi:1-acyl-sn-glycerol-3-phosphate acyltransferase
MTIAQQAVITSIKGLGHLLCQVEANEITRVPSQGPLILVSNHINFLDGPLLYTLLQPRPVTGFAKTETWDHPILGPMFSVLGAIPIQRGQADMSALNLGLEALKENKILAITPEGTRSQHGRLQVGHAGMVTLACRSNAPIMPLGCFGGEQFHTNIRRLRRTKFRVRVGKPFRVNLRGEINLTRTLRTSIMNEIMYRLAILLPPDYRGVYSDIDSATTHYLDFDLD